MTYFYVIIAQSKYTELWDQKKSALHFSGLSILNYLGNIEADSNKKFSDLKEGIIMDRILLEKFVVLNYDMKTFHNVKKFALSHVSWPIMTSFHVKM